MSTKKITTGALMVAMATVLSMIALVRMPQGGTVTAISMAPIIIFSFTANLKYSLITAFVYSIIQMMLGGIAPPTETFLSYMLVILLDYVFAFTVLGFAGSIKRKFKDKYIGACVSTLIVTLIRFICHFLSGILIWSVYAPEGQSAALYSLIYNGSYMSVEIVITAIASTLLVNQLDKWTKI